MLDTTKKVLSLTFIGFLLITSLFLWTTLVQANDIIEIPNPLEAESFEELLDNVINYIFWFATAITPILVLVGGFMFMTSGGSVEKVATAKRIITYTVIGYAIVLFSRGLIYVLAGILGQ